MAREPEDAARELIEAVLDVRFDGRKMLDSWGQTDGAVQLSRGRWALLEVETTQKHPCTNVLKVWPYLEDHPDQSVVLLHVFPAGAKNERSSRGSLGTWVADKMVASLGDRFVYFRFLIDADSAIAGDIEGARKALLRRPGEDAR